jgi:hypothetical protein
VDLKLSKDDPDWRRKLREAYPFGERAMLPYKVWLDEIRRVYPWAKRKPKMPPLRPKEGTIDEHVDRTGVFLDRPPC